MAAQLPLTLPSQLIPALLLTCGQKVGRVSAKGDPISLASKKECTWMVRKKYSDSWLHLILCFWGQERGQWSRLPMLFYIFPVPFPLPGELSSPPPYTQLLSIPSDLAQMTPPPGRFSAGPSEIISAFSKPSLCIIGARNLSFIYALSPSHQAVGFWRLVTVSPVPFFIRPPTSPHCPDQL